MQLAKKNARHFNTLNHEGKLLIVATIVELGVAKLFYTIKQDGFEDSALNQSQNTGWEDFKEVVFPNEVGGDESVAAYEQEQMTDATGKYLLRSLYQSAAMTADAPVQLVSHEGHVYLFRQSLTGTLLVDRFVLDGITNSLVPKYEVRFRRSRQRYKPLKEGKLNAGGRMESVDSLGFRDMRDQFFFEPTTEVCPGILNQMTNGWFAVVATPTNEPDQYRWHIFAYNGATKKVDLVTLRANSERLFEVRDYGFRTVDETEDVNYAAVPGIIYRTLAFENEGDPLTITNGLAATRYDIQRTQEVEDGDTQLMRDDTKLLLAVPTDQGIATVSFGIAADGTLAQFGEAGQQTLRSQDREVFLPHSTLDNIRALAAKTSATEGAIAGLSLATGDENVTNRVHVTTGSADGAKSLSYGDLVELTESTSLDGLYQVESPTPEGFKITPTSKSLGSWTKVETEEPELIFDGLITGYELKDGKLQVNAVNHGLTEKDLVQLVGTRDYNGQYPVLKADQNSFTIERLWVNGEVLNVKINSAKRRGLVFDGKDDYIEIPLNDGLKAHKRFTLEAWVKVPSGERQILFDTGQAALEVSRGKFAVRLRQTSGDSIPLSADNKVVTDQWVHIAGVFDGAELTLYENGELQGSAKKVSGSPRFSYAPAFMLGRHHEKTANFLDGELAEVRLWNTSRSPKQIKDSMNLNLTGRETGLVGYWRLGGLAIEDDGSQRVFDFSVNANHGLAHGAPYASGVTLKRKLKDGTTDASKFSNSDLVAVVEGETYEESFEFQVDSDAITFKPSYWGRVGEAAEGKIKIAPLENYQDFKLEKLNGNWQRATCRFVVPPGVRVVRCFELDQVTGKWTTLSLRRHRLHLISDRVTLATASSSVKLNNILPKKEWLTLHTLTGHTSGLFSAEYSPDGQHILTASWEGTAGIWNANTGMRIATLSHKSEVKSAKYSPDGKFIVTASWDKTAAIWDAKTGQQVHVLSGHKAEVNRASYSPDGKFIATESTDGTAMIWDANTGGHLRTLDVAKDTTIMSLRYSPDGQYIAMAKRDGTADIWNTTTGKRENVLRAHTGWVNAAEYSPDGKHLVTIGQDDATPILWNAFVGTQEHHLNGHRGGITAVSYSPDGRRIVTASSDETAIIWDVDTGQLLYRLVGHSDSLQAVTYSPDGQRIVTASSDNTAIIWNASTGQQKHLLTGHQKDVHSAKFSPDGQRIVTTSGDATAKIWEPFYKLDVGDVAEEESTFYHLVAMDGQTLEIYTNQVGTGDHWYDLDSNSFHQDWKIQEFSPGSGTYTLTNRETNTKLGVKTGAPSTISHGTGLNEYEWKFEKNDQGEYAITSKNGVGLVIGDHKLWRLAPVFLRQDLDDLLNQLTLSGADNDERNSFMLGLEEGGANPKIMTNLPDQTDPRGLMVRGALLDFAQSATRLQSLESSEGCVILSYQDHDGNLRQTRYNTTDADGTTPEAWLNDRYRTCLTFDGTNRLLIPSGVFKDAGERLTIEFWAKGGPAFPTGSLLLEAQNEAGKLISRIAMPDTSNKVVWDIGPANPDATTLDRLTADVAAYRERWTHWAFVLDRENNVDPKIYANGQPLSVSKSSLANQANHIVPLAWQGQLAELRIWNEALSASEIEANSKMSLSGNEPGLLAYYPLTDTKGTTARNLAAPALPLTVNNTQWSPFTGSLSPVPLPIMHFDGRSFAQTRKWQADFSQGLTIEARVRFDSLQAWTPVIDFGEAEVDSGLRLYTTDKNGQLMVYLFESDFKFDNVIEQGKWLHLAVTADGKEVCLYVNGVKKKAEKQPASLGKYSYSSNYIGKSNFSLRKVLFEGEVAEVRLWNCARTEEQIRTHSDHPLTEYEANLVRRWPLDGFLEDRAPGDRSPLYLLNQKKTFDGKTHFVMLPSINADCHNGLTIETRLQFEQLTDEMHVIDLGNGKEQDNILLGTKGKRLYLQVCNDAAKTSSIECPIDLSVKTPIHLAVTIQNDPIPMTIKDVMVAAGWSADTAEDHLTDSEQRNHLIWQLVHNSKWAKDESSTTAYFQGFANDVLIGKAAIYAFLLKAKIKTAAELKGMTDEDWRKCLMQENQTHGVSATGSDRELIEAGLGWGKVPPVYRGRIYINGEEKICRPVSLPTPTVRSSNYIGKSNWSETTAFFQGEIEYLRLWKEALDAEEIKAITEGALPGVPVVASGGARAVEYSRVEVDAEQRRRVMLKRCLAMPGEDSIQLLDEKRIEELDLKWVGNAQIKPTLVGYIEGPPPVPSENLTEEDDYNGAAAVELIQASDVEYSWTREQDVSTGAEIELFLGIRSSTSAGVGVQTSIEEVDSGMKSAADFAYHWQNASTVAASHSLMTSEKLELRGSREVTPKFAHLGQRFVPKNVGYALVTSGLADVFVSRLKRSGRMLGYQVLPVEGLPLDVNTITFMINPTYTMSGCLDGMTGSSATSNRFHSHVPEMRAQYGSLYPASYFRLKEAYALKQEIEQRDQEHAAYFHQFNARLVDETSLGRQIENEDDALLKEIDRKILDNETELDRLKRIEAKTGKALDTADQAQRKKCEDELILLEAERKKRQETLQRERQRTGETRQLEIAQAFDDQSKRAHASESFQSWQRKMEALQLRAGKRNIVNTYVWDGDGGFHAEEQQFASTIEHSVGGSFELNLMVGFSGQHAFSKVATDLTALAKVGLTQTMTKTESSSKGLELHVDLSGMESRGITDHRDFPLMPGEKVDRYRFMSFFLEPHSTHFHDFFNTVVDPEWLMSNDEEARALRQTMFAQPNKVWRVLHRVTYVERPALIGYGASLTPPPAEDEFGELRQQLEALNQKIEELKTAVAKLKK
ncbi:MAG: hypothetical protein JNJ50_25655 [Acidobacteria bacterium]|nr:hypothetical protein [Acidobacteriota bacterium]